MPHIFYYQDGLPKVLQLDEDNNMVYQGDPTPETLAVFTGSMDLPLEILDPKTELSGNAREIQTRLHRDFEKLLEPKNKKALNPMVVFKMLYAYLKAYQVSQLTTDNKIVRYSARDTATARADAQGAHRSVQKKALDVDPAVLARYTAALFKDGPCADDLPGCTDLTWARKKELEALGEDCTVCNKNAVDAKYETLMLKRLSKK
jgi:hypothetical protein